MKVIQIMPEFGLAGAETMCENLCYELKKDGIELLVVSLYDYHSAITERLENAGIKILYMNKKPGLDLSMIPKLRKVFKKERPDVVHTHRYVMQYAVPASIGLPIKRIHTVHNVAEKEVPEKTQKLNYVFYHSFHVVPVALSKEVRSSINRIYRIPQKKIPVIYNGIDLSRCIPKESYETEGPLNILHIGRFSQQKNHKMLIETFSEFVRDYPESTLVLIGGGELEEEMEQLAASLGVGDKVRFEGLISNVYPYLHKADIFVLPSNYEGMPMTLIEAMGTGLPIIATDVGGISSMVNNNVDGILISNDKDELKEALEGLLSESKRQELGIEARKKPLKVFSSAVMGEKYIKLYKHR